MAGQYFSTIKVDDMYCCVLSEEHPQDGKLPEPHAIIASAHERLLRNPNDLREWIMQIRKYYIEATKQAVYEETGEMPKENGTLVLDRIPGVN